ncbi:flagellin [Clostridium sp. BL-8]|uniref:flagellin n=1 Tax=Clostridium sp. BL-8 TaxID=349938 RepID=UPI0009CF644B|nr:flagellin [Clostridium sp. BL-8]OOM79949.1 flagellin [Clostridium sp. BL-8]
MQLMHNMYSLKVYNNYKKSVSDITKRTQNISSGKKISSAKDDPKKIGQLDKLKISLSSRSQAEQNVQDVNSMIQTYDGALQETNNSINRLKELVTQAGNNTYSDGDREALQKEIDELKSSINDLANNTSYNGIQLSQSNGTTRKANVGELAGESIDIPYFDVSTTGLNLDNIDITTSSNVDNYLNEIDTAGATIASIRSKYGALETSLQDSLNNYDEMNDTMQSNESDLEDADIASEYLSYSSSQMLMQAGISLMAQSNQLPQDCLNLLVTSL